MTGRVGAQDTNAGFLRSPFQFFLEILAGVIDFRKPAGNKHYRANLFRTTIPHGLRRRRSRQNYYREINA